MNLLNTVLWGVLPYIVLTIFIGGHIYRYKQDQFGWTAKSSEFLDKKGVRIGSQLFHWGIILVLIGHFLGIIVPVGFYEVVGITEGMYHNMALIFGIPAGIATIVGLIMLSWRRVDTKRIKATTSVSDWITLIALLGVIGSGLIATFFNLNPQGFDYRATVGPWFRGLFIFNVNPELMVSIPVWFKVHVLSTFILFITWPFTRLVHVFSLPFMYYHRNYVVYRKLERKSS